MCDLWAKELLCVKNNVAKQLTLYPSHLADADLEESGRIIMANNSIKRLYVCDFKDVNVEKYQPLFLGISQNKSIEHIRIDESDVCDGFLKLFLCESLSSLYVLRCEIRVDIFETLQSLQDYCEITLCTFNIGNRPNKRAKLESFNKEIKLNELRLWRNRFDNRGYEAVARLLLNSSDTLKTMKVDNSDVQSWHPSFFNGLKGCKSLEVLKYTNGWDQEDLVLMASVLPNLPLRELNLSSSRINTDAARAISDGISQNRTLETLVFDSLSTTNDGLVLMIRSILGRTSTVKDLNLHYNNVISGAIMLPLVDTFINNCTLERLVIREDYPGTASGWRAFSRVLGSSRSVLREIDLSDNAINDGIISDFAYELSGNPDSRLKCLDISENRKMCLSITNIGWGAILNLLCNTSSIDATWSSNHTLCDLGKISVQKSDQDSDDSDIDEDHGVKMPVKVHALLEMNKQDDKKQVARMKVIEHHFSGDFDASVLAGDGQKLLPRTISYFGRDSLGYPAVYNIIRTMPDLCSGSCSK